MNIAVVLTTYNRPDALTASLEGYNAQTDRAFEIIVADDGSGEDTAAAVTRFKKHTDISLRHVWQEDKGFRAGVIRNRAVAATEADYVIFSDGDCIPLPNFVEAHRRLAEKGWFVAGNRILLSKTMTESILTGGLHAQTWPTLKWLFLFLRGNINRWLPLCRLPVPMVMRKLPKKRWKGVMTCNLAVWRKDLIDINGFDESYKGWGLEDSDLVIRLIHAGLRHKSARFATPVLHLWHTENDRALFDSNRRMLCELIQSQRTFAVHGIRNYL